MIKIVEGNMLRDIEPYSVLLHQVNCMGKMGAGLAAQMAHKFDGLFKSYHEYCSWFQEGYDGKSHRDEILGTWHKFQVKDDLIICNAFGQERYGRNGQLTDYDAWHQILRKLELQTRCVNKNREKDKKWKIHAPYKLGCGLGGGDWEEMYAIIEEYFKTSPVTFVLHKY